jgi:hypothetical protein
VAPGRGSVGKPRVIKYVGIRIDVFKWPSGQPLALPCSFKCIGELTYLADVALITSAWPMFLLLFFKI